MGWQPSCCGADELVSGPPPRVFVNCGPCADDTAPDEYQVVIAGITDDLCTGCSIWNGTWIVPWSSSTISECIWLYNLTGSLPQYYTTRCHNATAAYIRVYIQTVTSATLEVHLVWWEPPFAGNLDQITYKKAISSQASCDYDHVDVPVQVGFEQGCQEEGSTCTITGL